MNQRKAEAVLTAVKRKYKEDLIGLSDEQFANEGPKLVRDFYRDGDHAVVWEAGPYEWAIHWKNTETDPAEIFTKPIYSYALGIYDA